MRHRLEERGLHLVHGQEAAGNLFLPFEGRAQRFLGPSPIGHVEEDPDQTLVGPALVHHRRDLAEGHEARPVPAPDLEVARPCLGLAGGLVDRRDDLRRDAQELADVPAQHLLGAPAEEPFGERVPVRDGVAGVGRDHRVLHAVQQVGLEPEGLLRAAPLHQFLLGLGVEAGVVQRDRSQLREAIEDVRGFRAERDAVFGVRHAQDPDHLAPRVERDRHHRVEHTLRIVRRSPIPGVVIGNDHRLAGLPHPSRHALAPAHSEALPVRERAHTDADLHLIGAGVGQVHEPVLGPHQGRGPAHDGLQHLLRIETPDQPEGHLMEGLQVLVLGAQGPLHPLGIRNVTREHLHGRLTAQDERRGHRFHFHRGAVRSQEQLLGRGHLISLAQALEASEDLRP